MCDTLMPHTGVQNRITLSWHKKCLRQASGLLALGLLSTTKLQIIFEFTKFILNAV